MYIFVNWVMQKSFLNLILNYTKKERLKVKILFFWQILFIIDIKK